MKISPKYTVDDWNGAFRGEPNWNKAMEIVKERI